MRLVRWAPSERVDVPDITAMSFLMLGEFRRTLRALVSGDASYVVQGFKVEPESPATTRIRVRLQPPGEFKGAAIGGEQTSPGLDYGQLIGNRDSSFFDEGASQQFIDFVGQPVASYTIEMRFTYTDGVSDNRAFWNSGTNSEFVAVTNTRHVSGWQIQRVASPSGGQWIPLATVAWDGVAVDAADITDTRVLLFEGASPFTRATQDGTGAVEDFDRTATRADDAVGRFRLREVVRALQRQVQDLKGPSDGGVFDWFSRVYRPYDPAGVLPAQRTKTLRSIDTVTYTVGDGVTTFGDFNGATGVEACLDHIEALSVGNRPERIEVVVHGGVGYTITTPKFLQGGTAQPFTVTIRGAQTLAQANLGLFGRPRITIDNTGGGIGAAAFAVVSGNGGNLILRGLDVLWTGDHSAGRGMFGAGGYLEAYDCTLQTSGGSPDVDTGFTLFSSFARKSRVENCLIHGRVQFYDAGTAPGTRAEAREGGLIANCRLEEAQIVLQSDSGATNTDVAVGFTIRDCSISGRTTAIYTGTGTGALISGASASRVSVLGCEINYGLNENALDARTYKSAQAFKWVVRDCIFTTSISNGTHAAGAGVWGADGTGWAINVQGPGVGGSARGLSISGCRFGVSTTDAGGVRIRDVTDYSVDDCAWEFCGHNNAAASVCYGVLVDGCNETPGSLSKLRFANWVDAGIANDIRAIYLTGSNAVTLSDSQIYGWADMSSTPPTALASGFDTTALALRVSGQGILISNCVFAGWASNTANSRCIRLTTSPIGVTVKGCYFNRNGGYFIDGAASGVAFVGNTHRREETTGDLGVDAHSWEQSLACDNAFMQTTGPGVYDAIRFNAATVRFTMMGNTSADGQIRQSAAGTNIRGYGGATDLNNVNAYV